MVARGASRYSIEVAKRSGYDITNHRSTMIDERQLRDADLVLTMEIGHAEALRAEFAEQAYKVYMLAEMVGHTYNIADPYGGPFEEYERMYAGLTEVIDAGLDRIILLAKENANGRG